MSTVYTKTPKGVRESTGKTRNLSGDLRDLLELCKGLFTVEDISAQASPSAKEWFAASIAKLVADGYLRDVPEAMRKEEATPDGNDLDSLDFSKPAPGAAKKASEQARLEADKENARREAEEKVRREIEEKVRREAEEKVRREIEEKARREAEEKVRREIEEKARREAEEKAKLTEEERARREAEEKVRREVEEKARREAEEKARREAEEKARRERREKARREEEERIRLEAEEKVRREIEEKARREAEEKARLEAEEKARVEAVERARREAEAKLRREIEEKLRREAEEKARLEAEEKARLEAEERARREAEEKLRREIEEKLRREAEEKLRREAEEKARLEAEERDREAIRERVRLRTEKQRRLILPLVFGLFLPLAAGILLQILSFDGKRAEFEKAVAEAFGVPVKVGSTKLGVLAGPQWLMNDVVVGADAETAKIARVRLGMSWLGIFGAPLRFESIHLEAPQLPIALAVKLLGQAVDGTHFKSGEIRASGLTFDIDQKNMPALDIRATFDGGRLTKISGQGENPDSGKFTLALNREDQWRLALSAAQARWLVGSSVSLADLTLKGDLAANGLQITEFSAALPTGELAGSGKLDWQGPWRASGKLEAKRVDAAKLAPGWFQEGSVSGNALMFAESEKFGELFLRPKLSGSFGIGRGVLGGIDLDKVLQDRGQGEQSRFESLSGEFSVDAGRVDLSEIKLTALELKATGSLSVDTGRNANGRLAVEAKSGGVRRTVNLRLSGSLAAPRYQR